VALRASLLMLQFDHDREEMKLLNKECSVCERLNMVNRTKETRQFRLQQNIHNGVVPIENYDHLHL
jgi:hypothetical protein